MSDEKSRPEIPLWAIVALIGVLGWMATEIRGLHTSIETLDKSFVRDSEGKRAEVAYMRDKLTDLEQRIREGKQ